jgi:hypothetical protein
LAEHEAKSWPQFFQAIKAGNKLHDLRHNDRPWAVGDTLKLREFDPVKGEYTGDEITTEISFITNNTFPCAYSSYALDRNCSILSLKRLTDLPVARDSFDPR